MLCFLCRLQWKKSTDLVDHLNERHPMFEGTPSEPSEPSSTKVEKCRDCGCWYSSEFKHEDMCAQKHKKERGRMRDGEIVQETFASSSQKGPLPPKRKKPGNEAAVVQGRKEEKIRCTQCRNTFGSQAEIREHKCSKSARKKARKDVTSPRCPECDKALDTLGAWQNTGMQHMEESSLARLKLPHWGSNNVNIAMEHS